jgi:hypothetical protein
MKVPRFFVGRGSSMSAESSAVVAPKRSQDASEERAGTAVILTSVAIPDHTVSGSAAWRDVAGGGLPQVDLLAPAKARQGKTH